MRKVLYATDGSSLAQAAGRLTATFLRGWTDAEVIALYVTQVIPAFYQLGVEEDRKEKALVMEINRQLAEELFPDLVDRVSFVHETGFPPNKILDVALDHDAGLIVMGSHGYRFMNRLLLGSVSHEVFLRSGIPVLIVPETEPAGNGARLQKILFATDGTAGSEYAGDIASALLTAFPHAELTAMYVMQTMNAAYHDYIAENVEREEQSRAEAIRRVIASGPMNEWPTRWSFRVAQGNPARVICDVADDEGFDLIVMGSHGYDLGERLFRGSVSNAVANRSHVPVLIAKTPQLAAEEMRGINLHQEDFPSYPLL